MIGLLVVFVLSVVFDFACVFVYLLAFACCVWLRVGFGYFSCVILICWFILLFAFMMFWLGLVCCTCRLRWFLWWFVFVLLFVCGWLVVVCVCDFCCLDGVLFLVLLFGFCCFDLILLLGVFWFVDLFGLFGYLLFLGNWWLIVLCFICSYMCFVVFISLYLVIPVCFCCVVDFGCFTCCLFCFLILVACVVCCAFWCVYFRLFGLDL